MDSLPPLLEGDLPLFGAWEDMVAGDLRDMLDRTDKWCNGNIAGKKTSRKGIGELQKRCTGREDEKKETRKVLPMFHSLTQCHVAVLIHQPPSCGSSDSTPLYSTDNIYKTMAGD